MNKIQKIGTLFALVASLSGCNINKAEQRVNWSNFIAEVASSEPVRAYAQRDGSRQYVTEIPKIDKTLTVVDKDNDGNPEMGIYTTNQKSDNAGWIDHYLPEKSKNNQPNVVATEYFKANK